MSKPKLDLRSLNEEQAIDLARLIAQRMTTHAAQFSNPEPPLVDVTDQASALHDLLAQRAQLIAQTRELTLQIHDARTALDDLLTQEALYVDGVAKGAAAVIAEAGMAVAAEAAPVGAMPKVTGLVATQGDADGAVDLHWEPVRRGLLNYTVELTTAAGGQGGWQFVKVASKSSASATGLTTGQRYWFRVTANGAAGAGAPSDVATKTAP